MVTIRPIYLRFPCSMLNYWVLGGYCLPWSKICIYLIRSSRSTLSNLCSVCKTQYMNRFCVSPLYMYSHIAFTCIVIHEEYFICPIDVEMWGIIWEKKQNSFSLNIYSPNISIYVIYATYRSNTVQFLYNIAEIQVYLLSINCTKM